MDIGNIGAFIVVSVFLLYSIGSTLNIGKYIYQIYDNIYKRFKQITPFTIVTMSLLIGSVCLAILTSMY